MRGFRSLYGVVVWKGVRSDLSGTIFHENRIGTSMNIDGLITVLSKNHVTEYMIEIEAFILNGSLYNLHTIFTVILVVPLNSTRIGIELNFL